LFYSCLTQCACLTDWWQVSHSWPYSCGIQPWPRWQTCVAPPGHGSGPVASTVINITVFVHYQSYLGSLVLDNLLSGYVPKSIVVVLFGLHNYQYLNSYIVRVRISKPFMGIVFKVVYHVLSVFMYQSCVFVNKCIYV